MIQKPVIHKRGTAFKAQATATVEGVVMSLEGLTIASQIRTRDSEFPAPGLSVVVVDAAAGRFDVVAKDTDGWPVGPLIWDIRVTDAGGNVSASETVQIICERGVTR